VSDIKPIVIWRKGMVFRRGMGAPFDDKAAPRIAAWRRRHRGEISEAELHAILKAHSRV